MFALGALVIALAADSGAPALPACVNVAADARYVPYGYNHVVILKNGCSKPVSCTVSTDVNPQAQNVDVQAGTTVEVTTFMGSPQRAFTPRVRCKVR